MRFNIVIGPNNILNKIAEDVDKIDDKLIKTMKKMLDLMYDSNGIGLAAPQVGISKRFFVTHIEEKEDPLFCINPIIVNFSKNISFFEEGCLSFPGVNVLIDRPETIEIEYVDIKGSKQKKVFFGLYATCIQHEIDHLNGITIIDHKK